jgi:hypothetical protein
MAGMATKLRLFLVPVATSASQRPHPEEQPTSVIPSDGDEAKHACRAQLVASGLSVRSLNWSPDPSAPGKNCLVAYATKKES